MLLASSPGRSSPLRLWRNMGRWAQARKRGSTPEPAEPGSELPQIGVDDWSADPSEATSFIVVQLLVEALTELFDLRFRFFGVGDWTEDEAINVPGPVIEDTGEPVPVLYEVQVRWRGPGDEVGPWSASKTTLTGPG